MSKTSKPLKIREGAYYRTRGGQVFGPMVRDARDASMNYPWRLDSFDEESCWTEGGRWNLEEGQERPFDLISEVYVSDTPPDAPASTPSNSATTFENCSVGTYTPAPETKTLRDEFAMKMMVVDDFMVGFKEHAEQLYRAADAMMEARKK